jgi:aryl-alcohol dehydrogenase-like predicted oxidoreductase
MNTLTPGCCPRRRWGKSELSIPVIPFGTQGFGDNFGPVTDEEACGLIRRAVDLGVNHFDCARCYGNSLRKLGRAVREGVVRRDEILVSGRLCCHSAAPWGGYGQGEPDYSAERALADVEDQLELLGIGYFDAMLIHDPRAVEPTLVPGGCLEGLERLKERGLVRNIGYGMRPHEFHLQAIGSGRIDVLLTFSDYNLLRQTAAADILPAAAARDIGVLNGWSILRGILTGRPVEEIVSRDRWLAGSDAERAEQMRLWCRDRGLSLLPFTLQFCLREPRIHGNPIGSLNIEQLEMNVAAVVEPLPEGVLDEFLAAAM